MKASDIPDRDVLEAVLAENVRWIGWAIAWHLTERFPGVPEKVVLAKLRQLLKRGLLDGCPCGCRGDWQLTRAAAEMIGASRYYNMGRETGWMTIEPERERHASAGS